MQLVSCLSLTLAGKAKALVVIDMSLCFRGITVEGRRDGREEGRKEITKEGRKGQEKEEREEKEKRKTICICQ